MRYNRRLKGKDVQALVKKQISIVDLVCAYSILAQPPKTSNTNAADIIDDDLILSGGVTRENVEISVKTSKTLCHAGHVLSTANPRMPQSRPWQ
jgi:hypothetical protein